ncbi:MAG TPA: SH3 domain-containing protein [Planctomycetota bacterium]|nr:SH3 domain-containing protein [Planctomycetota bacterium]
MMSLAAIALLAWATRSDVEADYRAGNYAAALAELRSKIDASPDPDARALYDAGNCAYRLGRHSEAAWLYRRALLRTPRDEETRFNLRLAEHKLGYEPPQTEPLVESMRQWLATRSPRSMLAVALALETAGLAGLLAFRRRAGPRTLALLVLAAAFVAGGIVARPLVAPPRLQAVVLSKESRVRSEPRDDLPVVLTLKAGETVAVDETSERWARVRHAEGRGWVPRDDLGLVN